MLRRAIFWSHLSCGVAVALVVLSLCVTGVLLTYERQIEHWLTQPTALAPDESAKPLPLEELLAHAAEHVPLSPRLQISLSSAPDAPVAIRQGRRTLALLHPYTGETVEPKRMWVRDTFSFITRFHRWFAATDDARPVAKFIVGVGNLAFLFLIVSGLYLWFPRLWRARAFAMRLWFARKPASTKARDYNWHHVLGIWMAVPLVVLIVTGSVFSFRWTGDVIYAALGVERPERTAPQGRGPGGQRQGAGRGQGRGGRQFDPSPPPGMMDLREIADVVAAYAPAWQEVAITLPRPRQSTVAVLVDRGTGGQPTLRENLQVDRTTGEVVESETFDQAPAAQRIRGTVRFLHTGEYFGVVGQTVAGLASLAGVLMVWTGLALAYRRLIQPIIARRRRARRAEERSPEPAAPATKPS